MQDRLLLKESSIALALGYFHIDDQGKKIPLVVHLKKAIDEAEENHSATHKDEDNFFDIYKDRLVISDDHTGIVYVPKRLVEANKDFYEGTELVDFDIDYVNEEITYGDSDSAEEYISRAIRFGTDRAYANAFNARGQDRCDTIFEDRQHVDSLYSYLVDRFRSAH